MLPIKILLPFANMSWNMTVAMFQLSPLGFVKVITHKHMWNRMVDSLAESKTNSAEQHNETNNSMEKQRGFIDCNFDFVFDVFYGRTKCK